MPRNPKFDQWKWRQIEGNQQTMTKIFSVLKAVSIHQHAEFQAIPPMRSQEYIINFTKFKWHQNEENQQTVTKI